MCVSGQLTKQRIQRGVDRLVDAVHGTATPAGGLRIMERMRGIAEMPELVRPHMRLTEGGHEEVPGPLPEQPRARITSLAHAAQEHPLDILVLRGLERDRLLAPQRVPPEPPHDLPVETGRTAAGLAGGGVGAP